MPAHERYTKELRTALKYSSTWLPSAHVALGDVGRMSSHGFEHVTTLERLGVVGRGSVSPGECTVHHMSHNAVSLSANVELSLPADVTAGFRIEFAEEHAVAFAAGPCRIEQLDDLHLLQAQLIELSKRAAWEKDWAVVTQVVSAKHTTAFISGSAAAFVELGVTNEVTAQDILAPSLRILRSRGMNTQIVSRGKALTPLFQARSLKKGLFGGRSLNFVAKTSEAGDDFSLVEVGFEFED
jgi:hypothetical protein